MSRWKASTSTCTAKPYTAETTKHLLVRGRLRAPLCFGTTRGVFSSRSVRSQASGSSGVFRPFGGGAAVVLCQAEPADQGHHPAILPQRRDTGRHDGGRTAGPARRISSARSSTASPRISAAIPRSRARSSSAPPAREWLSRRFNMPAGAINPETQVLPLNGSREGLFFAMFPLVPESKNGGKPVVLIPNPFYSVYPAATIAAGAEAYYVPARRETGFLPDFDQVPELVLRRTVAAFFCSPSNPESACASEKYWRALFELATVMISPCSRTNATAKSTTRCRRSARWTSAIGCAAISSACCRSTRCRSVRARRACAQGSWRARRRSCRR